MGVALAVDQAAAAAAVAAVDLVAAMPRVTVAVEDEADPAAGAAVPPAEGNQQRKTMLRLLSPVHSHQILTLWINLLCCAGLTPGALPLVVSP